MAINKRNILIVASSILVASGVGYIAYTKIRNKGEINKIHAALDGASGSYGSIEDFANVFAGNTYVNDMKTKYKNLIMLKDDYVTALRLSLYKAIQYWGTDEAKIKDVFNKLKDRVAIAQVAASYQKYYGENLLDALKGEMDVGTQEMRDLKDIIIRKYAFRVNK